MKVLPKAMNNLHTPQKTLPIPLVIAYWPALLHIKWKPFLAAVQKLSPVKAICMKAFLFKNEIKRSKHAA